MYNNNNMQYFNSHSNSGNNYPYNTIVQQQQQSTPQHYSAAPHYTSICNTNANNIKEISYPNNSKFNLWNSNVNNNIQQKISQQPPQQQQSRMNNLNNNNFSSAYSGANNNPNNNYLMKQQQFVEISKINSQNPNTGNNSSFTNYDRFGKNMATCNYNSNNVDTTYNNNAINIDEEKLLKSVTRRLQEAVPNIANEELIKAKNDIKENDEFNKITQKTIKSATNLTNEINNNINDSQEQQQQENNKFTQFNMNGIRPPNKLPQNYTFAKYNTPYNKK